MCGENSREKVLLNNRIADVIQSLDTQSSHIIIDISFSILVVASIEKLHSVVEQTAMEISISLATQY